MTTARIRQQLQEIREKADPRRPVFCLSDGETITAHGISYQRRDDETGAQLAERVRQATRARPLILLARDDG